MFECLHSVPGNDEGQSYGCFYASLFEDRVCYSVKQCDRRGDLALMIYAERQAAGGNVPGHPPMTR